MSTPVLSASSSPEGRALETASTASSAHARRGSTTAAGLRAKLRALHELGKPNLSLLVVVTAVIGFFLATTDAESGGTTAVAGWLRALMLVVGTGLTAMGACAANMCREAHLDARMARTRARPIPSGRVSDMEAFAYSIGTFLIGFSFLHVFCGPLPALLALATTLVYAFVYTPSKLYGPISVWVGAVPGAIPPVMGWATVTQEIGFGGLALFALLFTWQFPHFLALAFMYRSDYARAGFRFLPEGDDGRRTGFHIGIGTASVVLASLAPAGLGLVGPVYLTLALLAGAGFMAAGLKASRGLTAKSARRAFFASILYLPVILVAIVLDRLLL